MEKNNSLQKTEDPEALPWHSLTSDEVLEHLRVKDNGLSPAEVEERLRQYGPNQLMEGKRTTFLEMLWGQFNNFIVMLLIVAAVVSALLGEWIDASAIMAIVLLNALLGIIQERSAAEEFAALKKMAAPEAQVMRDGRRLTIPSGQLVPGDIVFLEAGNFIPADVRLLEAFNLKVEEAALTGESQAVQKNAALRLDEEIPLGDRKNTAFMGTTVSYGRGRGVVTSTGMRTQLGLIAEMLQQVEEEETPLQRRLEQLGKTLGYGALTVCGLVFVVAIFQYTDLGILTAAGGGLQVYFETSKEILAETFLVAVSLAIAAVPEGLPAVVTISLALGMREMIRRHALIRKLSSVETLGSATVICSDKTGTLTQNEMTVTRLWVDGEFVEVTGSGYSRSGEFLIDGKASDLQDHPAVLTALWVGALNNDATLEPVEGNDLNYRIIGDPTEGSLLIAAAKAGAVSVDLGTAYPRQDEIPFDSERKRMITVHDVYQPRPEDISPYYDEDKQGWDVVAVKGAPDVVLNLCTSYQGMDDKPLPLTNEIRKTILEANEKMADDALRVLGVAFREVPEAREMTEEWEQDLVFVGLIGMIDPPRAEVRPALEKANTAGIRTVMITGDFPNTARAIAESSGLLHAGHQVLTGAELDKLSEDQLKVEVNRTDVFARVSPEHKMRIVDALQANGEVVAMTGDGVNDAPAIKRSDIGIAMGITGTDVAKQTADMVLTDDNYASIVSAVEQGRVIYSNIRKFVFYLLSSNVAEIMIIFLATLAGLPAPLTAIQLLWLNLVTDGAPALALAMEKGDPDIMDHKPRHKDEPIINRTMGAGLIVQTIAQTGVVLFAFALGLLWHLRGGEIMPPGSNPLLFLIQYDWRGVDVQTAETMAFITLSLCELFRAYTVRSERVSVFRLGIFTNKYMQYAVAFSLVLVFLVVNVPFLQPIFNTHFLSLREWGIVFGLAVIPAIAEEITKFFMRQKKQPVSV